MWGRNDKIYFFKGSDYYKFDPKKNPPVDSSYPRPVSNWQGVPNNIDAALQYSNGNTYFFKQDNYYRYLQLASLEFAHLSFVNSSA